MYSSRSKLIATSVLAIIAVTILTGCELSFGGKSSDDALKIQNLEDKVNLLQKNIDDAKKAAEVAATATPPTAVTPTPTTPATTPVVTTPPAPIVTPTPVVVEKKPPADSSYITIAKLALDDTLDNPATVTEYPVKFNGFVSPNALKITVQATSVGHSKVDEYTLKNFKPGSKSFNYGASPEWNNLSPGTNTYIFTAYFEDGTSKSTSKTIFYHEGGAEMGKPVIYLYPTKETNISVNVKPTGGISVSIPAIGNGWNVTATPDGRITNLRDQKQYPYLFWEGFAANFTTPKEGFVVAKDRVSSFFDAKLSYMGMNQKEIADFKEFWVPRLATKPYYFITFIDQESIDRYAPLTVSPKPDTTIRVFFDYKGLDQSTIVAPQKLKAGLRNGFTLIEWGGRLYR